MHLDENRPRNKHINNPMLTVTQDVTVANPGVFENRGDTSKNLLFNSR
jgi:hypothetical protein